MVKRLHAVRELARLCWQVSRPLTLAVGVLALLDAAAPVGASVVAGQVVGEVPGAADGGWSSPAGQRLVVLIALFAVLVLLPYGEFRWRLGWTLTSRVGVRLDSRVVDAFLTPPGIAHLDDPAVRDQGSRAVTFWNRSVLEGVINVAVSRAMGTGSAVVVTWYVPWLGPLLAVAWILIGRWTWRRASQTTDVMFSKTREHRRAEYTSELALTPHAAKETRVFGLGDWLLERFTRQWTAAMGEVWARRRTSVPVAAGYAVLLGGSQLLAFGYLGWAAATGRLGLSALAVAAPAALAVSGLGAIPFGHYEVEYGLRTVPSNIELARLVGEPRFRLTGTRSAEGLPREAVRLEDVRFRYPGHTDDVLRGVDLAIPARTSLAVVGSNGAGKTTLVKLLCRFFDPSAGRVTVDRVDLATIDPRSWHRRVAAIVQDFLRYPLTAAQNVSFGAEEPDRGLLDEVAARAGALGLVRGLPDGWDTPLGREFGGVDLSGGEWQRLALARALYAVACGAGVLVLDEPTAHLDARAEADLYDRFLDIARDTTTIVISHRFSTVRHADRIVVLSDGRITEQGTHTELLDADGRYAELFRLQAARFHGGTPDA